VYSHAMDNISLYQISRPLSDGRLPIVCVDKKKNNEKTRKKYLKKTSCCMKQPVAIIVDTYTYLYIIGIDNGWILKIKHKSNNTIYIFMCMNNENVIFFYLLADMVYWYTFIEYIMRKFYSGKVS